jgi:pilus assembly protein CpaF
VPPEDHDSDSALVRWLLAKAVDLGGDPDLNEGQGAVESVMQRVVNENAAVLRLARRERLVAALVAEASGLGALEKLITDPTVTEVMVNGPSEVWAEREGRLERADLTFRSEAALREAIDRLLAGAGRRVDEMSPMADARLPDGSRLNVVLPPLSGCGPTMTIRRFPTDALSLDDLVAYGTLSVDAAKLLRASVASGDNILVCGATGSGKSTTLAALAAEISPASRIITIEDTAELRINHPHVVGLATRPAGSGGKGGVTMRDLVRNALRMRPDRLIIGEVRGPEALDMIDALATGHSGSLSTVHASSPVGALDRLVQLSLQAATGLSQGSVRERVWEAIDLVVHQERSNDGGRLVRSIVRLENGEVQYAAGSGAEE